MRPIRPDPAQVADDIYRDRCISGDVYCGKCGYNLRTLPHAYTCPECGNAYNARPLTMKGIFSPHEMVFPSGALLTTIILGIIAGTLMPSAINGRDIGRTIVGFVVTALALAYLIHSIRRLRRFWRLYTVARRIEAEEGE